MYSGSRYCSIQHCHPSMTNLTAPACGAPRLRRFTWSPHIHKRAQSLYLEPDVKRAEQLSVDLYQTRTRVQELEQQLSIQEAEAESASLQLGRELRAARQQAKEMLGQVTELRCSAVATMLETAATVGHNDWAAFGEQVGAALEEQVGAMQQQHKAEAEWTREEHNEQLQQMQNDWCAQVQEMQDELDAANLITSSQKSLLLDT